MITNYNTNAGQNINLPIGFSSTNFIINMSINCTQDSSSYGSIFGVNIVNNQRIKLNRAVFPPQFFTLKGY